MANIQAAGNISMAWLVPRTIILIALCAMCVPFLITAAVCLLVCAVIGKVGLWVAK